MDAHALDNDEPEQRAHDRFLATAAIVAAAGLWLPQLTSSFRLDETATHWLVSGGVVRAVERSQEFQGESPFYTLIAYATRHVFGSSELALRIPSLLAMALAAWLVFRLGRRLAGREIGLIAAVVFVSTHGMAFAAGDARPYALSIAALAGSTLALVRWTEEGRRRDAAIYVVLVAAALYMHYLTGLAIVAHPLYVRARRGAIGLRHYAAAAAAAGILMIPAVPHLASLVDRREHLEVPLSISLVDLFTVLVPPLLVGTAIAGVVVAGARERLGARAGDVQPGAPTLALAWWIITPVVLYLVSRLGSTTLFEPRFLFFSGPALALVAGGGISTIRSARARRIVVTAIVIGAVLGFGSVTHSGDDWRAAAEAVRSVAAGDTPVLVRTGFIESTQLDWLGRPGKIDYLLAPLSPYPMAGEIVPLPYALSAGGREYLERVVDDDLVATSSFLLVNDYGGFRPWLEGRLSAFSSRTIAQAGLVSVVLFERAY